MGGGVGSMTAAIDHYSRYRAMIAAPTARDDGRGSATWGMCSQARIGIHRGPGSRLVDVRGAERGGLPVATHELVVVVDVDHVVHEALRDVSVRDRDDSEAGCSPKGK